MDTRGNVSRKNLRRPTRYRRPLIIELIDENEPMADVDNDEALDEETEVMSLATGVAMIAAAYCRGTELHGAGGLPKWSSNEASAAGRSLLGLMFDNDANGGADESRGFGDAIRDCLARCLGEAAAYLAFSLAIEPEPRWGGLAGSRMIANLVLWRLIFHPTFQSSLKPTTESAL